jgi:hypothetical protein
MRNVTLWKSSRSTGMNTAFWPQTSDSKPLPPALKCPTTGEHALLELDLLADPEALERSAIRLPTISSAAPARRRALVDLDPVAQREALSRSTPRIVTFDVPLPACAPG